MRFETFVDRYLQCRMRAEVAPIESWNCECLAQGVPDTVAVSGSLRRQEALTKPSSLLECDAHKESFLSLARPRCVVATISGNKTRSFRDVVAFDCTDDDSDSCDRD